MKEGVGGFFCRTASVILSLKRGKRALAAFSAMREAQFFHYSHVPNSRGVTLAFWPKKMPKMAILRDKLKDFEKTKRGEAMK